MIRLRRQWWLSGFAMVGACGVTTESSPQSESETTGDHGWDPPVCDFTPAAIGPVLPECSAEPTDVGAAVVGSGQVWHIPAGCSGRIYDGEIGLNFLFAPNEVYCPDGIDIESLATATPTDLFAVSPIYEFRPAGDRPCEFWGFDAFRLEESPSTTSTCGYARMLISESGSDFREYLDDEPPLLGLGPIRVVGARQCPSSPICTYTCVDVAISESNCGGCNLACDAVCDHGECIGWGFEPEATELPMISDGDSVYWTANGAIRRLSFADETPAMETLVSPVHVRAWAASDGAIAWIDDAETELRLRRMDSAGEQSVVLPFAIPAFPLVQSLVDATIVVSEDDDAPLFAVARAAGDAITPLDCFGETTASITVTDLASEGATLLVLADDNDPDLEGGDLWRCPVDGTTGTELVDDAQWPVQAVGSIEMLPVDETIYLLGTPYSLTPPATELDSSDEPFVAPAATDRQVVWYAGETGIWRYGSTETEPVLDGVTALDIEFASGHLVLVMSDVLLNNRIMVYPLPGG